MSPHRELAVRIARCQPIAIDGQFHRHSSPRWAPLTGSDSGGRWGRPGTYPVLYLGRPPDSVIVEAYRHLVDDVDGMRGDLVQPRRFITCDVTVTNLLNLRNDEHLDEVGLSVDDLHSPPGAYEPCQRVAAVAHQLGLHGIVAPAASQLGVTLALFEQRLPATELPTQVGDGEMWDGLPADPRRPNLRLVDDPRQP